ncbi:MAG: LptF/LptG family permease [Candidatus Delongbacteria bacterium]|nr:LptF/LptG family permease [Candidatus Delongbacteria bacterium]MBN2834499.1 LptF/LptG family permease [Candidatus Delongbacteria bacterium]
MRILYTYIIKEHIFPFFMSLGIILFLFVLNIIMKMMSSFVGKGIDILIIIEFFYLSLGWILAMAIPMSVLVATLMAYGRLAQDNEYAVMQSSGISIFKVLTPAFTIGIALSFFMLSFNNHILPEMNHKNKLLKHAIKRKKPMAVVEPGFFINDIPGVIFKAEEVDNINKTLTDVIMIQKSTIEKSRRTITAKTGKVYFDENSSNYNFEFYDGEFSNLDLKESNNYIRSAFSKMILRVEDKNGSFKVDDNDYYSDREKSTDSLMAKIQRLEARKASKEIINSVKVEYYKKFAISFACLIFALTGAPLGLMSGKGGLGSSAVLSIILFTIYWIFLMSGEDLSDRGLLNPVFAMWNANIITGILGVFMIWQASKGAKISFGFIPTFFRYLKSIFSKGRNA